MQALTICLSPQRHTGVWGGAYDNGQLRQCLASRGIILSSPRDFRSALACARLRITFAMETLDVADLKQLLHVKQIPLPEYVRLRAAEIGFPNDRAGRRLKRGGRAGLTLNT